ncbi:hypothetical protein Tco_1179769 [Tanacetum coccineum]
MLLRPGLLKKVGPNGPLISSILFVKSSPRRSLLIAYLIEARFEAIVEKEKEQIIKKKGDVILSLQSELASHEVKGSLDVDEDIGVDEVSSAIDGVFDSGESNVESMEVRSKFGEFLENKESVEEVVVSGGEAFGVDEDESNRVISVLKDGGGEFDDRLDVINLDLSQDFVIRVLKSRDVSGGSLVGFFKWVYREKNCEVFSVTSRWESCGSERRKVVRKTSEDGRTSGSDRGITIWDPGIKSAF